MTPKSRKFLKILKSTHLKLSPDYLINTSFNLLSVVLYNYNSTKIKKFKWCFVFSTTGQSYNHFWSEYFFLRALKVVFCNLWVNLRDTSINVSKGVWAWPSQYRIQTILVTSIFQGFWGGTARTSHCFLSFPSSYNTSSIMGKDVEYPNSTKRFNSLFPPGSPLIIWILYSLKMITTDHVCTEQNNSEI